MRLIGFPFVFFRSLGGTTGLFGEFILSRRLGLHLLFGACPKLPTLENQLSVRGTKKKGFSPELGYEIKPVGGLVGPEVRPCILLRPEPAVLLQPEPESGTRVGPGEDPTEFQMKDPIVSFRFPEGAEPLGLAPSASHLQRFAPPRFPFLDLGNLDFADTSPILAHFIAGISPVVVGRSRLELTQPLAEYPFLALDLGRLAFAVLEAEFFADQDAHFLQRTSPIGKQLTGENKSAVFIAVKAQGPNDRQAGFLFFFRFLFLGFDGFLFG